MGKAFRKISESVDRYHHLFEFSSDAIMTLSGDNFTDCNAATLKLFGCESREQFCSLHPGEVSPETQLDGVKSMDAANERIEIALKEGYHQFEWQHMKISGEEFTADVLLTTLETGEFPRLLATVRDISKRKKLENELQLSNEELEFRVKARTAELQESNQRLKEAELELSKLAHYDNLTKLANRNLFHKQLGETLKEAHQYNYSAALILLDLDRFKHVNDSLGHLLGDRLLQEVALKLNLALGSNGCVARWGGDEFTIIIDKVSAENDPVQIAKKIIQMFKEPFDIDGLTLFSSASLGIATFPSDTSDPLDLLKFASFAMHYAKLSGKNTYKKYDVSMNDRAVRYMELESKLRHALDKNEFHLNYQAQFDINNEEILGGEALIRWQPAGEGLISPLEFIPVCEDTGLIIEIGEWVLRTACVQGAKWLAQGICPERISVNVSGIQLQDKNFIGLVKLILNQSGFPAERLLLEITESVLVESQSHIVSTLTVLKSIGVHLSIDDFGTGYCSFSYLRRFPIDCLKVDRSFVRDIAENAADADIVRAMVAMGKALQLNVIAEGVENINQVNFLKEIGCPSVQGFLFSRPLAASDFGDLLTKGVVRK